MAPSLRLTLYRLEGGGPHSLELSDLQMRSARFGRPFEFDGDAATLSDLRRWVEDQCSVPPDRQEYHCLSGRALRWRFDGRVAFAAGDGFVGSMNLLDVMNGYERMGWTAHNDSLGVRFLPGTKTGADGGDVGARSDGAVGAGMGGSDGDVARDGARLEALRAVVGAAEARTARSDLAALDLGGAGGGAAAVLQFDLAALDLGEAGGRTAVSAEAVASVMCQRAEAAPAQDRRPREDGAAADRRSESAAESEPAPAPTLADPADPPSELRLWLRDLDLAGTNRGRFEGRYAAAFEREFDRLEDVALSADQEGVEGILSDCGVTRRGDRARVRWAIKRLSRPPD